MDTSTNQNNHTSSDQDSVVCWICHDKSGVLLTNFCRCSGSLGHVHQSCMQTFVDSTEGGTEKEHCPTCKRKYKFIYYSKDGKEPPAQPQSFEASAWLFFSKFLLPISLEYGLAILELVVNWIAPSILVGSAVFLGRAIAIDFWTSRAEGVAGLEMRKEENRYYDYAANYMEQSVFDAMLVGLVLLGLRKRINSGKAQILSATTPHVGAPVAPMGEQPQAQQGDENLQQHDINNNNMALQGENLRNLADLDAFVREDDEEETDDDDDDDEDEEEEEQEPGQDGILDNTLPNQQGQEQHPAAFDERVLMNAMNAIANAEEGVLNANDGAAAAAAAEANNENIIINNNNNNRRRRNRRNRRKGGNTFDLLLWKGVAILQSAARYPHSDPLSAYDAILLVDTPFMIVTLLFLGLSPIGFCLYHIAWIIHSGVTKRPPKLRDLRNRFEEAGRRLKNESTQDDRDRYYHIYCFDATFLYLMLSLVCGIVAHESMGRTNFTQNENLKKEVLTQYLLLHNNTAASLNNNNNVVEYNQTLNYLYVDSLLNPWTIFSQGILPRFFNVLHHPWNALFHWIFGYLLAGAITAIESQLITPVFAPGCNLVYFRSIHLSDELATFRFMLIQLYDINIVDGISHCFKLFGTYGPFIFFCGWLVSNSLRFSIILGYILYEKYTDSIAELAIAILDGSINDRFHNSAALLNGDGMAGFAGDALDYVKKEVIDRSIAILAACPSAAIGDWSVLWPGASLPGSFWLSLAFVVTGASAFYFLPYQYLVLRRFLPLAKALARALSLSDFLFEPSQMLNVDNFMEVSAGLPVRSDNVMELPVVHVPIHQTSIRRERFLDPSKIPRFHQIRVVIFVHVLLAKAFVDWIVEVCLQRVLIFSVASAAIRSAFTTYSFDVWSLVPDFAWSKLLRICFDPLILWWKTCTSITGFTFFATWADRLNQFADFFFGASPFLPFLFPTNNTSNVSSAPTINDNIAETSTSQVAETVALVAESVINLVNQSAQDTVPFEQQPPFMLVGFWLIGLSLVLALVKYPSELSMAAGYLLVTPLAIVLGLAEFVKPAWDNWAGTIESIWRSAYGVRRVITPNTTTTTKEEQDDKSNKDNKEEGGKKKNKKLNVGTNLELDGIQELIELLQESQEQQQKQQGSPNQTTKTASPAAPGGVSNDEQFIKLLEHMTRRLDKNNNNAEGFELLRHRQERERQLLQDLEDNGMFDPTLEEEQTATNNATAIRQWLDIQQNNNNHNKTNNVVPDDALAQLLFMQQQQQQRQQHHDDDDDDEDNYRIESDADEVANESS